MEESTLKNIVTIAAVFGGAWLVYANRHKLHDIFVSRKSVRRKEVHGHDAMSDVRGSFVAYADIFQGLYEPMFKASVGEVSQERMKNVITEWDIRMNTIKNIPIGLRGWWSTIVDNKDALSYNELQVRAVNVMRMLEQSGIVRDSHSYLTADNETNRYYQHIDGVAFESGQKLHVESACWYMHGNPVRIIEKGYCEIV